MPGITEYACFPFFMAYAVQYLRLHGVDAGFYDAVALHHWDHEVVKQTIARCKPEILFLETSTPMYRTIREFAIWAKERLGARIVLTGPHVQAFAGDLMKEAFVDHCVIGEYEAAALEIASDPTRAKPLYTFDLLSDINLVKGETFVPFLAVGVPIQLLGADHEHQTAPACREHFPRLPIQVHLLPVAQGHERRQVSRTRPRAGDR